MQIFIYQMSEYLRLLMLIYFACKESFSREFQEERKSKLQCG